MYNACMSHIAWFISPHGFGHAARAAAVMEALARLEPAVRHEVFTTVPEWFFRKSPAGSISYHRVVTDVGLVQATAFREDLAASVARLGEFYPLDRAAVDDLARTVSERNCALVVSDISPLGIAVARVAGVPSVLVENFTWDWIYRGYEREDPAFGDLAAIVEEIFAAVDYHVQAEPVCRRAAADLTVPPVARGRRVAAARTRQTLGIPDGEKMILLTSGGIPVDYSSIGEWAQAAGCRLVVTGKGDLVEEHERLTLLPHRSDFFHPDLVAAADAVVGKAGYSTLAEVCLAGKPFGFVARSGFRESAVLCNFVREEMSGLEIAEADFLDGSWLARLPELLALPRFEYPKTDGADQVAAFLLNVLRCL